MHSVIIMSQSSVGSPCTILLGYILANWSITAMGMSSHSGVSHCFSVSLSGARGDWKGAEDLDQLFSITLTIGMAILIAHVQ